MPQEKFVDKSHSVEKEELIGKRRDSRTLLRVDAQPYEVLEVASTPLKHESSMVERVELGLAEREEVHMLKSVMEW